MGGRVAQLSLFGPEVPVSEGGPGAKDDASETAEGAVSQGGPASGAGAGAATCPDRPGLGWAAAPSPLLGATGSPEPAQGNDRPALPVPGQEDFFGGRAGKADALAALAARARECRRCGLREGCRGVVFGEGDPDSGILFLGEGPGAVEDELGRPFVGPAGQLLDRILLAVGFRRAEVYISNTVLCRPPGNRMPLPEEVAACRVWLDERLAIMRPALVVCLGASAARALLGSGLQITRDRGRWYSFGDMRVLPTFHPAALLRDPSKKRPVWEDMKAVRAEWLRLKAGNPTQPQN